METKLNSTMMKNVRRKCGFLNGIDVGIDGSIGGLSLGNFTITLRSFSKNHIDTEVVEGEEGSKWRFTGFYCGPNVRNREDT